jgi:hypothetical protein
VKSGPRCHRASAVGSDRHTERFFSRPLVGPCGARVIYFSRGFNALSIIRRIAPDRLRPLAAPHLSMAVIISFFTRNAMSGCLL